MIVEGQVATPNGAKFVKQLCNHWAHKLPVEQRIDASTVRFEGADLTMTPGEAGIGLAIAGEDRARLEALKPVIESHLDRFAFREAPLDYVWSEAG
jgi:uncharacterized protein